MRNRLLIFILSIALMVSCGGKRGAEKEDLPKTNISRDSVSWVQYDSRYLSFEYRSDSFIEPTEDQSVVDGEWFRIVYPKLGVSIYCTYMSITPESFGGALEDSYRFAYSHAGKADAIDQILVENTITNVYSLVYNIEGDVATPIQFLSTDSVRNFFRGSFYYDKEISNTDSIDLINEFVRQDIDQMIKTIEWKNE